MTQIMRITVYRESPARAIYLMWLSLAKQVQARSVYLFRFSHRLHNCVHNGIATVPSEVFVTDGLK